jgi:hypothetical protein
MLSTGVVEDGCDRDLLNFEFRGGMLTAVMEFQTKSMRKHLITYFTSVFFTLFDMLDVLLGGTTMHNLHVFLQVEPTGHLLEANGALILLASGGGRLDIFNLNYWLRYGGGYVIGRNLLFFLFFNQYIGLYRLWNRFHLNYLLRDGLRLGREHTFKGNGLFYALAYG